MINYEMNSSLRFAPCEAREGHFTALHNTRMNPAQIPQTLSRIQLSQCFIFSIWRRYCYSLPLLSPLCRHHHPNTSSKNKRNNIGKEKRKEAKKTKEKQILSTVWPRCKMKHKSTNLIPQFFTERILTILTRSLLTLKCF